MDGRSFRMWSMRGCVLLYWGRGGHVGAAVRDALALRAAPFGETNGCTNAAAWRREGCTVLLQTPPPLGFSVGAGMVRWPFGRCAMMRRRLGAV